MKKIGIVGFGSFGELLASLCKDTFEVHIVEANEQRKALAASQCRVVTLEDLSGVDFIVLAVPISAIESTLKSLAPLVQPNQVVMDICSVKVYPVKLMKKYLKSSQLLATHPMFGAESAQKGLGGLQVALCPIKIEDDNFRVIKDFWSDLGLQIIETTPEEHDKDAAYSQAYAYSVAKLILNSHISKVKLTTRSYEAIREVAALSANDSDQLFHDMLFYNPYFPEAKQKLANALDKTTAILDNIEAEQKNASLF